MGLLSIFARSASSTAAAATPAEAVEAARTKARRRLIGAAVLLGVGVIAFPLIFETQPRPIPVDIPIVVPAKDSAPPLAMPASVPAPSATAAASAPAKPVVKPVTKPPDIVEKAEPEKTAVAPAKPAPAAAPSAPAASAAKAATDGGRYVIQIGAFAEDAAIRDARSKVEKLGLRTYVQAVETKDGKRTRVRVGPYTNRDEADKAAAKLKAAGLTAAVLTL